MFNDQDQVDPEMLGSACIGAAFCTASGIFVHAHIDCAEFFGPGLQEDCIRQYSKNACCSVGTVCGMFETVSKMKYERILIKSFSALKSLKKNILINQH